MNLSVVISVLGQHDLATLCIRKALKHAKLAGTKVYVVDNGNDYNCPIEDPRLEVNSTGTNLGVYPVFKDAFDQFDGEVLLFIHSDLIIDEEGYDSRIIAAFDLDKRLGLVGFVGSNEIDAAGGRGSGTTSNFLGGTYQLAPDVMVQGSRAEAHGLRHDGLSRAAVVDGCAMAIRRPAWQEIGYRADFPPHHFYDRLISTQMIENGWGAAVLGIGCDHLGGQTVSREQRYVNLAEEWARANLPMSEWLGNPPHYAWDQTVYARAEHMWLAEYRDVKRLVPIKV